MMNQTLESRPFGEALAYLSDLPRQLDLEKPQSLFATLVLGVLFLWLSTSAFHRNKRPLINPRSWLDISGKKRKLEYIPNCAKYMELGRKLFPDRPYRMATDMGEILVLPTTWAHEVRNDPNLSLNEVLRADFHVGYPGFEPFESGFADDGLLLAVSRKHLAKYAGESRDPSLHMSIRC